MSCPRSEEIELDAYLVDPRDEAFAEFRQHWPICATCTLALVDAAQIEGALNAAAEQRGGRHPAEDALLSWLDGAPELEPSAREDVGRHVAGCRTCSDEVRALRQTDSSRSARPAARGQRAPFRRPLLAAAALFAALVLGAAAWNALRASRREAPLPVARNPAAPSPAPSVEIAPPFEPPVAKATLPPPAPIAALAPASPAPAPPAIADAAPAKAPKPRPVERDRAPEPTAEPTVPPEPVVVAALASSDLPTYVAPADARGGARHESGVVRSAGDTPRLRVLAPDHVGRTQRAAPTLYFHLDRRVETPIEVVVVDPNSIEPLVEIHLDAPTGAGIHGVDLASRGVQLVPGVAYQWSVALVRDPDRRAGDVVATAAIERVAAASAASDADSLARAGLFYDALAAVGAEISASPSDPRRRARRAALLEQVGLGGIVEIAR